MRIVFFRHAERVGKQDWLAPNGHLMAEHAREWLHQRGYVPTHAIHTKTHRTRETMAILLDGAPIVAERETLPKESPAWWRYLDSLATRLPADATVLVVGHGGTQRAIEARFQAAAPAENRCAGFVLERAADGAWRCADRHAGSPTSGQGAP